MGLTEFTLSANSPDVDELVALFKETENRQAELRERLAGRNAANRQSLDDQFAVLSALLLPGRKPAIAQPRDEFARAPGPGDPAELTAAARHGAPCPEMSHAGDP